MLQFKLQQIKCEESSCQRLLRYYKHAFRLFWRAGSMLITSGEQAAC